MTIDDSITETEWNAFLMQQRFRPFLQSWTMGEVYREIGQEPVRLCVRESGKILGICYGHIVPARRGRHIAIPYGPVINTSLDSALQKLIRQMLFDECGNRARKTSCRFLRWSPFIPLESNVEQEMPNAISSPLHLLAEHIWYLPLTTVDTWDCTVQPTANDMRTEADILKNMRKTTRNLIGRAERDGVTIEASAAPERDLEDHFIRLHDETRKRHKFTPYTNAFFRSQVKHFSARQECTVYLAKHLGEVIAASVHMHACGETSYHHGASSRAHAKIPASYLLQWRAIQDAMKRGDHVYNFWGIAPVHPLEVKGQERGGRHPFAGVTLFKTGFGGALLNLMHCHDIPVTKTYWLTYAFETLRKWRRGF